MSRRTLLLITIVLYLSVTGPLTSQITLQPHRQSSTDLEVTGLVNGIPSGQSRFISRQSIAALPQLRTTIKFNENFPELAQSSMKIAGVYLDELITALGATPNADTVLAICQDGYTGNFPPDFVRSHRPIFVLEIDGLTPHEWAVKNHKYDAGPYFITYEDFVPAFHVLAHQDRPQEPAGIIRLDINTSQTIYSAIIPQPTPAPDSQIDQGFRIAQQNCFRCHNAGKYGGIKGHRSWQTLANMAKKDPRRFEAWTRNPQSLDPKSEMTPNPQYDQATLDALTKYFQSFPSAAPKVPQAAR